MTTIPFLKPNLVKLEKYEKHLRSIEQSRLYSNFGPLNSLFEDRIKAEYFHGIGATSTVNNATSGLMIAMATMKRPGGRYAVMPSFTFSATPLAAIWAGLDPYFVDVNTDDFSMSEESLLQALERLGEEVAVVVPYATFGFPIDLSPYARLFREGMPVVVDAAASFGASRYETAFGTGFPGAVVFSFHATKAFGIGEGGLVYSADPKLVDLLRSSANFGFGPDKVSKIHGLNAKLPEISAAIGLATLDAFPEKSASAWRFMNGIARNSGIAGSWKKGGQCSNKQVRSPISSFPCSVRREPRITPWRNLWQSTELKLVLTSLRHAIDNFPSKTSRILRSTILRYCLRGRSACHYGKK